MDGDKNTRSEILKKAASRLQKLGFNGFSLQDLADDTGIKKPSLFHHFKSKDELGRDLIQSYHQRFKRWTESVSNLPPDEVLNQLFEVFIEFFRDENKICPSATLSNDYLTLPKIMKIELRKFGNFQKIWLTEVIKQGQEKRIFLNSFDPERGAEMVISSILGAQAFARVMNSISTLKDTRDQICGLMLNPKFKSKKRSFK